MKFGLHLPLHNEPSFDSIFAISLKAEELGFDSLWVGDHILGRAGIHYVGPSNAKPDKLEAWTTLGALAAITKKVKLGPNVSPIPLHHPSRLAKMATTIDVISKGRLILGLGAGYVQEEFESYGFPWADQNTRIAMMKEGLDVILKLWTQDDVTLEGRFYKLKGASAYPKPVQKPHPPIWFGGASTAFLEETARMGDGWTYVGALGAEDPDPEVAGRKIAKIKEMAKGFGRNADRMTFAPCPFYPGDNKDDFDLWRRAIQEYSDNGSNYIILSLRSLNEREAPGVQHFLERFRDELMRG